ncbi:outer membrane protein assembly factor BamC [Tamilnaduibacter salinus]|nr:outer membrane protein assembly factor BamC [Tamilnaduibacter salinus]
MLEMERASSGVPGWAPLRVLAPVVLLATLAGCTLTPTDDYQDAPAGEPLKVGPDMSSGRIQPAFPIPTATAGGALSDGEFELPRPPDMTSEILEENYVVQEVSGQTWLLVNEVPGRVWPAVSAWMTERNLGVNEENPAAGLLQSDIVNYSRSARDLVGLPDEEQASGVTLLQARISPGVRRKTTEIQLRLRERATAPDSLLPWPTQSDRRPQEKNLLADLGDFLEAREDTKSYSRAALNIDSRPQVKLVAREGEAPYIRLDLDDDRAWVEVKRAIEEADIPLVDFDRSAGTFYVDFRSEEAREAAWWNWFGDAPEPEATYLVELDQSDGAVHLTTRQAPEYEGNDRSQGLLSELFDYLY